jgi:L-threonylcarbamoyladenylate synthase
MKKYWYWDEPEVIQIVADLFAQQQIIAGTSDTIIGLLAPLTQKAKDLLDLIKQRVDKPYLVLVQSKDKAAYFSSAIQDSKLQSLLHACWPGPLTIIVRVHPHIPSYVSSQGTVALRVPNHQGLQRLLQLYDGLFSTSANISGEPVPQSVQQLSAHIVDKVAMILDDRVHKASKPSTIIDCTGEQIRLIREGAYTREFLENYITFAS